MHQCCQQEAREREGPLAGKLSPGSCPHGRLRRTLGIAGAAERVEAGHVQAARLGDRGLDAAALLALEAAELLLDQQDGPTGILKAQLAIVGFSSLPFITCQALEPLLSARCLRLLLALRGAAAEVVLRIDTQGAQHLGPAAAAREWQAQAPVGPLKPCRGLLAGDVLEARRQDCQLVEADATLTDAIHHELLEVGRHPCLRTAAWLEALDRPSSLLHEEAVQGREDGLRLQVAVRVLGQASEDGAEHGPQAMRLARAHEGGELSDEARLHVPSRRPPPAGGGAGRQEAQEADSR
mmetsp:Transcript_10130/g.28630  ORF Transcript_10130/g.28630 Transcript_10130/m.28630 type:complete len:295 (-) Transcript_10130:106-990(-)